MINVEFHKNFELIKNTENYLLKSKSEIKKLVCDDTSKFISTTQILDIGKSHFLYSYVLKFLNANKNHIKIINLQHPLSVIYNKPTNDVCINLTPLGTEEINLKKIGNANFYALPLYAAILDSFYKKKFKVSDYDMQITFAFMLSLYTKLFARKFGLLASNVDTIYRMKLIIGLYIAVSFFNVHNLSTIAKISQTNINKYLQDVYEKYDFTKITEMIKAFNQEKVLDGIDKFYFSSICLKFFGINFLAALEDFSRFYASIVTSSAPGPNIIPGFIGKYNPAIYKTILQTVKTQLR